MRIPFMYFVRTTRALIRRPVEVVVVFSIIPDYICHFHFLKDIGKDLFGHDYTTICRHLKIHAIRSHLRKTAKGLKKAIDADPDTLGCLHHQGACCPVSSFAGGQEISAILLIRYMPDCVEPQPQKHSRSVKDSTCCWRGLSFTLTAVKETSTRLPSIAPTTTRTNKTIHPSQLT